MQASRIVSIGVLLLLAACSGDPSPSGPREAELSDGPVGDGVAPPAAGAIVSAAVPRSLLPVGLAGSGSLVFVSATPGSFPGATRVHIVGNQGDSAVALVREGGFDPLPVQGTTGGVVSLSIFDSAGHWTMSHAKAGPAAPRVVRTSPGPRRTNVPLNVRIMTVFSAPVDSASAVAGVQLLRSGEAVPIHVRLLPDRLAVVLTPDAPLEASTTYEVTVAVTVQDVFGTALGAPVNTSFTTGTSGAGLPFMSVWGYAHPWRNSWLDLYRLQEGDTVGLAMRQYENGPLSEYVEGVPTRWSSSDTTVLEVVEQGPGYAIQVGLRPGRVRLRAEALGVVVERDVEVVRRLGAAPDPYPATLLVQVNVTGTDPDTKFSLSGPDICDPELVGWEGGWYEGDGWCGPVYAALSSGRNSVRSTPGEYTVTLRGITTRCVATDGLTRNVSLASRQTVNVTFSVDCGAAASTLRVRTTNSGEFLQQSFYVFYSNWNCLDCWDSIPVGKSLDISVGPGQQHVTLLAPDYCLVQGPNPVQATVSAGAVLEAGFAVLCTYLGQVNVSVSTQGTNVDESFWIEGSVVGPQYDGSLPGLDRQLLDAPRALRLPARESYRFLLSDVAANCRVVGDNPATVEVLPGVATPLNFNVTCE